MVLPFLDQAPVLSVHEGVVTSFANLEINNQFIDTQLAKRNERCKFYLVRPLNILIPMDLFPSKFLDYGLCQIDVTEVDYSHVADLIIYGNENQVLYPGVGGFIEEIVEDNALINLASNGEAINSCTFDGRNLSFKRIMVHEMLEASLSKLKANKASKPIMVNSDTALMVRIESYLLGGYLTNRVPLLMGQSAVAKSATVKALCAKHGFRLVDLRTGFMSRLDIQGLTEIEYQEDGTAVSYNCGMEEFIECTDEYIKYCRDAIPKIEEAIDSCVEPDKKKGLQAILKKYQEGAKIPVLFLDEIKSVSLLA